MTSPLLPLAKNTDTSILKKTTWKLTSFVYCIFGSITKFITIDFKHHVAQSINSTSGKIKPIRTLTKILYKRKFDTILNQNILGIDFRTPIGTPAGYDKNAILIPILSALDFGFCTIGSVTEKPCPGNPKPWIYKLPKAKSFVVNAGLCNDGSTVISDRLEEYTNKQIGNMPVIVSVAKTNCREVVDVESGIADYIATINAVKDKPIVKIIELNISCPNTYGGEPFTTSDRLEQLLDAVSKLNIKQPIFIKMPVDFEWKEFAQLLDVAIKYKISGVTIANLTKDRDRAKQEDNLPDKIRGNFSGKLTWDKSNNLIAKTYSCYGDKLVIIGVGGIMCADDAYTKIKLGASLVETATGFMFFGPQFVSEINENLSTLIKKDGYTNIHEVIGVEASNAQN